MNSIDFKDFDYNPFSVDPCLHCGFFDSDYESCTCPSPDRQFACPLENESEDEKLFPDIEFGDSIIL